MIYNLAEQENQIAHEFLLNNYDLIRNTEELIELLTDVSEICNSDALPFYFLNGQMQSGLIQYQLSILRRHGVQAQLMLRYSIETACLAAYSLHHPDVGHYLVNDEIGSKPVRKVTDKVYKWLEKQYPDHSKRLKMVKNRINDYYAHGNLFASMLTLDRETYTYSYFDRDDVLLVQSYIWELGQIASIMFDLIYQTAKNSPIANVHEDTYERFKPLLIKNQEFRLKFMKEKLFTKWHGK